MTLDGLQGDMDDMDLDGDKIDEAVLALLHLTLHDGRRAWGWGGVDWDSMTRLHKQGWISDPVGKARSACVEITKKHAPSCLTLSAHILDG
jgi:hypothetical protein